MSDGNGLHKVFVYGTLKSGQPNEYVMNGLAHCVYLGSAETVNKFPLVIGSPWNLPQLLNVESKGEHVHGEMYEVDDVSLERLDEFEDAPDLYYRAEVNVRQHTGATPEKFSVTRCWGYFFTNYTASDLERPCLHSYSSTGDQAYDTKENPEHPDHT